MQIPPFIPDPLVAPSRPDGAVFIPDGLDMVKSGRDGRVDILGVLGEIVAAHPAPTVFFGKIETYR